MDTERKNSKDSDNTEWKPVSTDRGAILQNLYPLSSKETLDRILAQDNPQTLIQKLPSEDFFWLIKKVGEDDCLPLLKLASEDQWQYLLDLELWEKDRLHLEETSRWLGRLQQSDLKRLVKWLFSKGKELTYIYLFKSINVEIREEDETFDLEDGFFTLDDTLYVKILDEKHRETIENILRAMASEDFNLYHGLLLGLAGVIPAEMEEEMYRLRNVRLAEHGFLPYEESILVYSHLDPNVLSIEESSEALSLHIGEGAHELVPILPFYHAMGHNLLTEAFSRITDHLFLDRIRLEFGGLCNQILSADGLVVNELQTLIKTCQKAAGYLNISLEKLCGTDISLAEKFLRCNALVAIFRVGFGLALEVKWEAEGWLKKSWFYRHGLNFSFWGNEWGETLAGIIENRPRLYVGLKDGEEYKNFECLSELDTCRRLIHRLMVMDRLMMLLTKLYTLDKRIIQEPSLTFYPLLFNLWGRQILKLELSFSSISPEQAKELFRRLRGKREKPPYQMPGFESIFIKDFMGHASDFDKKAKKTLKDTLSLIWQEFAVEYQWVSVGDLDGRFTKFISIKPSHGAPVQ